MNVNEVLDDIRTALSEVKEQGKDTVTIAALENYLTLLEKDVGEDIENRKLRLEHDLTVLKAENDRNIAHAQLQSNHSLEMFKSVIQAGQSALKASIIINGGGAVALLAFTGKIWDLGATNPVSQALSCSIFLFCMGVLSAAVAAGTTYLTQFSFNHDWSKLGNGLNILTALLVIASYSAFGLAAYKVAASFGVHLGL